MLRGGLDANVLIYAADNRDPAKRDRAQDVLACLAGERRGVLTAQILGEYFTTITRKAAFRQDPLSAALRIAEYRRDFAVLNTTADVVEEAARGVCAHGFAYYDAQIWATARLSGIEVVLTEDFADGREVEGVLFIDPFSPKFDVIQFLAEESVR
ncbi:MAG: PIN domain-containing protein [Coriobacteriia bacterium]|nr:PIN domain-containing protein [Coriobacteriia bacterium]